MSFLPTPSEFILIPASYSNHHMRNKEHGFNGTKFLSVQLERVLSTPDLLTSLYSPSSKIV
jgi:hypothetical protein